MPNGHGTPEHPYVRKTTTIHRPKDPPNWWNQVMWMSNKGTKWEFTQTHSSIWDNPFYKPTPEQKILYGLADNLPIAIAATTVAPFVIAGGILAAPEIAASSLASGVINGGTNLGAQLMANHGDLSKVDVLSIGFAFGSGFIPGSTAFHIIRNSVIVGTLDGMIDYSVGQGLKTVYSKAPGVTASDIIFNSLGNAGALSFGKNPFLFEVIRTSVSTFPTTVVNKVVNDEN